MVKSRAAQAEVLEPETPAENKGRDPDYTVLQRQLPELRGGRLVRNDNMSVVGAAWKTEKQDEQTGEVIEYIGIKPHIKLEVGMDGLLLRTFRRRET